MTEDVWNTLLPVIVGGGIGVVGGLAGPPLSHWLSRKAEREKERTQKFEELIGLLYEHDHWLNLMRGIVVYGHEDSHPIEPLPKARAIVAMYFPDLKNDFAELDLKSKPLVLWMNKAGLKRIADNISEVNDGFEDSHKPYLSTFSDIISKLENYKYV